MLSKLEEAAKNRRSSATVVLLPSLLVARWLRREGGFRFLSIFAFFPPQNQQQFGAVVSQKWKEEEDPTLKQA